MANLKCFPRHIAKSDRHGICIVSSCAQSQGDIVFQPDTLSGSPIRVLFADDAKVFCHRRCFTAAASPPPFDSLWEWKQFRQPIQFQFPRPLSVNPFFAHHTQITVSKQKVGNCRNGHRVFLATLFGSRSKMTLSSFARNPYPFIF